MCTCMCYREGGLYIGCSCIYIDIHIMLNSVPSVLLASLATALSLTLAVTTE